MRPSDIVSVIRQALAEKGTTAYRASLDAGLPGNAIRYALEARATKSDRLAEICDALGLEFYVGPPRAQPPAARGSVLSPAALHDLETGARALNRVVADAGGDPVPDDLWPVLAARKGGAATAAENANLPPGARPVDVVELAATAGAAVERARIRDDIIERCQRQMGSYGPAMVKGCVDMDLEAHTALARYPAMHKSIVERCTRQMRGNGWADMDIEAARALDRMKSRTHKPSDNPNQPSSRTAWMRMFSSYHSTGAAKRRSTISRKLPSASSNASDS